MDAGPLVVETIRKIVQRVLSGQYAAGHYLPAERKLCEELGVSRGTLRTALADLEKLGAIERRVGDGTFVRELSVARLPNFAIPSDIGNVTLEGIHFIRKTLELSSLDYCDGRMDSHFVKNMKDCVIQMAENIHSLPDFLKYDSEFHRTLVKGCKNPAIYAAYRAIDEYRQFLQVYTTLKEGNETASLDYHKKILAAIQSRDKTLAKRYLNAHLDDVLASAGKKKAVKIRILEKKRNGKVYF